MTWLISPVGANDNGTPWDQGYLDGWTQRWSSCLAEQDGPVAESYLAGWMAGGDNPPAAPQPTPRLRAVRNR